MILGVRHFAVSSISEKLETRFQKLEEVPDSEERSPLQGKKAAPYTNKLCKGAAFLAEVAGGQIGKGIGEVRKLFLKAGLHGDLVGGHGEGELAAALVGQLAFHVLAVQNSEATNSHTYMKSGTHETWKKLH